MRIFSLAFFARCLLPVAAGVLLTLAAAAQLPGNGGTTGGPAAPQAATSVPLDGGAGLLLAGGIGLAWRKLRRQRRA